MKMSVKVLSTILLGVISCLITAQGACVHNDAEYQVGQSITGDSCDKCMCTQYGVMCELIHCPTALCTDRYTPDGECCEVCPNGTNCLYSGPEGQGQLIVPESGCKYSEEKECYCFYLDQDLSKMRTYCFQPIPFFQLIRGGPLPSCNKI